MEITKKDLEKILIDQRKEYQRYIKILDEDSESRIKVIGEGWSITDKKVDKLSKDLGLTNTKLELTNTKLDATFDMVGDIKEDIEIVKMDISFIKNALKQKADKDELEALEKRVLFLENKLKRA